MPSTSAQSDSGAAASAVILTVESGGTASTSMSTEAVISEPGDLPASPPYTEYSEHYNAGFLQDSEPDADTGQVTFFTPTRVDESLPNRDPPPYSD